MELLATLPVRGPFRLGTELNVLHRYDEPRRNPASSTRYAFSVEISGGAVEINLRQEEPGASVEVKVLGDQAEDSILPICVESVKRMFVLHDDPTEFFEKASSDPHLRLALALYPDLRPVLSPTPFEAAVRLLLNHRISPEQATQLCNNLREVCGIVPPGRAHAKPAFPGKNTLLAIPDRLLEVAGIPENKIRKIRDLAASLVGEPDLLEHICEVSDSVKAVQLLETVPGIGRRSAEYLLLHAYGFQDVVTDDPHLLRAVQRFYHLSELPDEQTVERFATPYIPWRSWWRFLLQTADETSVIA